MRCAGFATSLLTLTALRCAIAADVAPPSTAENERVRKALMAKPMVVYPYEARARRLTGAGILLVEMNPSGTVTRVSMAKSTGHAILDNAATGAFRQARFKPGTASPVRIPIVFSMADSGMLDRLEAQSMDKHLARYLGEGTIVRATMPSYPNRETWSRKEGKGVYELQVDKAGKIKFVKILQSSGDATFDRVTVRTLRTWRLRRGPMIVELPLGFNLEPGKFSVGVGR